MNKKAIQSANLHASTTHAQAKADAVDGKAEQPRPTLTFDGCGINGPDEYRTRLATFTDREQGKAWGSLLAAAPELLEALEEAATWMDDDKGGDLPHTDPMMRRIYSAIAKARGATVLELITARVIAKAKGSL